VGFLVVVMVLVSCGSLVCASFPDGCVHENCFRS